MKRTLGLLAAITLLGLGREARTATWNGAGTGDNWSTADNWVGGTGINAGNPAIFDDTGLGASVMDKAADFTMGKLAYQNTSGAHTLDLNGNKLNVSSFDAGFETTTATAVIQNGSLHLAGVVRMGYGFNTSGAPDAGGSVTMNTVDFTSTGLGNVHVGYTFSSGQSQYYQTSTGVWDMSGSNDGVFVKSGGGEFEVGSRRQDLATVPGINTGAIRFGDNWDIAIGASGANTQFRIGNNGDGELVAGQGGSFTGYFHNLRFASNGDATMDMSGIDNGYMFISGGGYFGSGSGSEATVKLGQDWTIEVSGGIFGFGYQGAQAVVEAPNLTLTGTLSRLYVGTGLSGGGSIGGEATVTLGGLGSGLTMDQLWVARNGTNALGTLTLPAGNFTVTGTAGIGTATSGSGIMNLNGTDMVLTSAATALDIGGVGRLNVTVGDVSSGPDIARASGYAVNIGGTTAGGGGMMITFTQNPSDPEGKGFELATVDDFDDIFYGLKWAGDRTGTHPRELPALLANDRIAWNDAALTETFAGAVDMFYDLGSDATYIGFYVKQIPEPASLTLLALGGLLFMRRRR